MTRLARHPDLLLSWKGSRLIAQNLENKVQVMGGAGIAAILGLFDRPREAEAAARRLPRYDPAAVLAGIRKLQRLGFLLPAEEARRRRSRLRAWKDNLASAQYHVASRNLRYISAPATIETIVASRVAVNRHPAPFKRYRARVRLKLRAPPDGVGRSLESVLAERRTVREFSRAPVSLADLARIVRGTWGRTGTIDGGLLGPLPTRTSPSGGALHPIEAYVLAWNVAGLQRGLYHYDVTAGELRRLKRGDARKEAVQAASGQRWVGGAGFVCIMTAVFARTLWKYQLENAYRILWLDAGHLAQTFCLLATSRGLGAFTTAALRDSYIEKLIGLDGIREFPVYLCGAGVPAGKARARGGRGRRRGPAAR